MQALQKDYLEYLKIEEATLLDSDGDLIKSISTEELDLIHGEKFNLIELLEEG